MKPLCIFLCIAFLHQGASAQTVTLQGECISNPITMNAVQTVNGKPAYQGTGTVQGFEGVTVNVYWVTPENVWVFDFDGQPFFQNSCAAVSGPPVTGNPSCSWTATEGQTCTGAVSFVLTGTGVALPVKFISFTAVKANALVQLVWKTATETNNKGFELQRSADGNSWTKIGFVSGAVNSQAETSYGFTDRAPLADKNYYRLVQYDLDNRLTFSPVASVDFTALAGYSLHTNSTNNGVYKLTVHAGEPMDISVTDLGGRRLIRMTAGTGVHQLDLSKYPAGMYLLRLAQNNRSITEKLIKK